MTYYDDIYVSKDNLVGELNSGWNLITSQLNLERLALVNHGPVDEQNQRRLTQQMFFRILIGLNLILQKSILAWRHLN